MKYLALLLLIPVAAAHGDTHIDIVAKDNFFEIEGETTQNPVLDLEPGVDYEITLTNQGNAQHDLQLDWDKDGVADLVIQNDDGSLLGPGQSVTVDFMVPDHATGGTYWCSLHKLGGMQGQVSVPGGKDSPGFGLLGAFAAIGLLAFWGRRA